jgi:hypothetical protein
MTTHPPGHPTGPTGPGRDVDTEDFYNIGEPHQYSAPPLPTLAQAAADTGRYLAQAAAVIARECDPASLPGGIPDRAAWYRQLVALNIAAAQRGLDALTAAHLPPCVQGTPQGPCSLPSGHVVSHQARP